MLKMAVLLSGSGRTLDNFHQRIEAGTLAAKVELVVSNVPDVLGLSKARNYGYPTYYCESNESINAVLNDYEVDIIALAGYLKLYSPPAKFRKAVINIHPSLIPAFCGDGFYGSRVHKAVKERGCLVSGCTVHFANEIYDAGPIIYQRAVDLAYQDSPDDIAEKVFAAECEAFPEAINLVNERGIDFFWDRSQGQL